MSLPVEYINSVPKLCKKYSLLLAYQIFLFFMLHLFPFVLKWVKIVLVEGEEEGVFFSSSKISCCCFSLR